MEKNQSKEKKLFNEYAAMMDDFLLNDEAKEIFDALKTGKNTYLRVDRVESSSYDSSWIDMIESCIPDIGTIVNNPRLVTKEVQDLVPVELARKTNSDSVKHLASHTQFIKEITDEGDVIPNKVLNIGADDEIKTYENRFIATVIRHLVLFVEKRYEFIKKYATLHDKETLFFKNETELSGNKINIETKVTVVSPKVDVVRLKNDEYIKRIEQMRQYILYFYNSKFMKKFKNERDVRKPILMTNIIKKNPLYHHCYELYRFLEAYDKLGVSYDVDEKYSQFDDHELYQLDELMLANYLSLQGKDKSLNVTEKTRHYKPTIELSSDDEAFVYGPLFKGPIQFVRVDEAYQRYLDSQVSKDIDRPLNEKEKEYYAQELDVKKLNRKEYDEKIKLLERKKWQKIQFDKDVLARIRERELEEERLRQKRIQDRLKEEEEYLRKFRQDIVDEARRFSADEENQVNEEEDFSYKPNALTSMRGSFDFAKMSKLDQELLLQQLSLLHADKNKKNDDSSAKEEIKNLPKKNDKPRIVPAVIPESEDNLPSLEVIPVAPFSKQDILTAGTVENQDKVLTPLGDDEKTEIPVRTVEVPVEVEKDINDNERLTESEKHAVLVSDLFYNEYMDEKKKNQLPKPRKRYFHVPFLDDDDDANEPFKQVHLLNKALLDCEEKEERARALQDLKQLSDDPYPEEDDVFKKIRRLNLAYKDYEEKEEKANQEQPDISLAESPLPVAEENDESIRITNEELNTPSLSPKEVKDETEDDVFTKIRKLNLAYKNYEGKDASFDDEKVSSSSTEESVSSDEPMHEEKKDEPSCYVLFNPEQGYYVSEGEFSSSKEKAKVYKDFDEAVRDSSLNHTKIVKL